MRLEKHAYRVAWVLVAERMELNKDVRKIIAKVVWETRREALKLE